MSDALHPTVEDHYRTAIEEMRASVQHMRAQNDHMEAEQVRWRADDRRETVRIVLYAVVALAAAMAAGGALWEVIRP